MLKAAAILKPPVFLVPYEYADIVAFDAERGTLRLTLSGNRTLYGASVPQPP